MFLNTGGFTWIITIVRLNPRSAKTSEKRLILAEKPFINNSEIIDFHINMMNISAGLRHPSFLDCSSSFLCFFLEINAFSLVHLFDFILFELLTAPRMSASETDLGLEKGGSSGIL